jgi:hypothetical protein
MGNGRIRFYHDYSYLLEPEKKATIIPPRDWTRPIGRPAPGQTGHVCKCGEFVPDVKGVRGVCECSAQEVKTI